jgi:choline-glycine betaine transporter
MHLPINTADSGLYKWFPRSVTVTAKLLVGALIIWPVAFPDHAAGVLAGINSIILATFNYWYVFGMAFFVGVCLILAIWPASGRLKLGHPEDKPEFSNFSWCAMMLVRVSALAC